MVVDHGPEAEQRLRLALGEVAAALPYLTAWVGLPAPAVAAGGPLLDGDWFLCDELLANGEWLKSVVMATGRRLGTTEPAVAASLFVLGYSYRVLTLAVTGLLLGGAAPGSAAPAMAMALSKGRPALVAYRQPRALVAVGADDPPGPELFAKAGSIAVFVDFVLEEAVDAHLRPLVGAMGAVARVGRRLLWGNIAASAATAFRTAEGLRGEWVKALGERLFLAAPPGMHGQGNFVSLEHAGRRGWYWERRNCCLNDRLPERIRCADCSLVPAAERRANYLAGLAGESG